MIKNSLLNIWTDRCDESGKKNERERKKNMFFFRCRMFHKYQYACRELHSFLWKESYFSCFCLEKSGLCTILKISGILKRPKVFCYFVASPIPILGRSPRWVKGPASPILGQAHRIDRLYDGLQQPLLIIEGEQDQAEFIPQKVSSWVVGPKMLFPKGKFLDFLKTFCFSSKKLCQF